MFAPLAGRSTTHRSADNQRNFLFFFSLDKDETLGVLFLAHLARDTIWSEKKLNVFPMKFDAVKVDDVF